MISEQEIRRDYVSGFEASQILNVNESRIRQILGEGRFSGAFKFADTWLIPREAVANYTRNKPGRKKTESQKAPEIKRNSRIATREELMSLTNSFTAREAMRGGTEE